MRALANTELEGLLKFDESYTVAGLDTKLPAKETRVHVATVQAMVKRVISAEGVDIRPSPGTYDCIIVDEAHRGYMLDAELREEDLEFRNAGGLPLQLSPRARLFRRHENRAHGDAGPAHDAKSSAPRSFATAIDRR